MVQSKEKSYKGGNINSSSKESVMVKKRGKRKAKKKAKKKSKKRTIKKSKPGRFRWRPYD